ncbi:prepilin-type N-terminal cleavage/methylation domain-containing protein, partial [Thermodesulfovibrio sp.]|uniref:prepilin-type N-terminal cleavage/methylation domain-containing protein n=1 Tax=Thermodesulfovibrio sp. TaxID=2067987 RepID=UPI003D0FDCBE
AKVSSYAEPMARACMMDAAAYCVENPDTSGSGYTITVASLKNCSEASIQTPGGKVILSGANSIKCDSTGSIYSGGVTGSLEGVTAYQAYCYVTQDGGGFKCEVK